MEIVVAIGHIVGAIVASTILGFLLVWASATVGEKALQSVKEELAVQLRVSVEDLENPRLEGQLQQFVAERFSSELFRNRLSDLCGSLQTVWNWLSYAAQVILIGAAIWFTFTDGLENAKIAWWLMAVVPFFWTVGFAFALLCKLLTGRFPGQAKASRKLMSEAMRARAAEAEAATAAQRREDEFDDDE